MARRSKRSVKNTISNSRTWQTGSKPKAGPGAKSRPSTKEERETKAQYEQYRRRRWCVVKKCSELETLCNVQVFLLIKDAVRLSYFSTEEISENWPTSWQNLVRSIKVNFVRTDRSAKLSDASVRHITNKGTSKRGPHPTPTAERGDASPEVDSPKSYEPAEKVSNTDELRRLIDQFRRTGQRQATLWNGMRSALTWIR